MVAGVKGAHAAHEQEEGEHARCALRDKGRPCNACNAPVQHGNEYDVEDDVADRGQDEQEQRRPAVAHGVEDAGAHVVDEQEQQTEHIDAQIERGVRENIRRVLSALMRPLVQIAPISVSSSETTVVVIRAVEIAVFMRR